MKKNGLEKILSVIIPIYNTEKYLKRCLDSLLLEEILLDIELILVNDGSKDNSIQIIDDYKKVYRNSVVVIDKENGGHGSTINAGIETATGKYIKVIDSDDWVNSIDFIEFVKRLKENDSDIVVTNYRKEFIEYAQTEYIEYDSLFENKIYNFENFDLKDLKGEYFTLSTSTYKTSILKQSPYRMFEKMFYVDMQFNIFFIIDVKTIVYFDLDIYRYFIGRVDQSMNYKNFIRNKHQHETVAKSIIDFYSENEMKLSENKKEYITTIIRYLLYTHYTIFCVYDKNNSLSIKQIKEFDKYLYNKSSDLYDLTNKIDRIKALRKFKFNIRMYDFAKVIVKILKLIKKGIR